MNLSLFSRNFSLRAIILLLFVFNISGQLFSVPAYPYPIDYTLPDGSVINILLKGDEKVRWAQTIDGYTILMTSDGYYEYGIMDNTNSLVPSGIRASDYSKRPQNEADFLTKIKKGLNFSSEQVALKKQIWEVYDKEMANAKAFPTTGNRKLICILIGYTDLAFTKTQAEFHALFNDVGYTAGGATGSVKDFYLENSYGQFNLTVDVVGPYTASNNMVYYGGNNTSGSDSNPRALAAEAVNLANPHVNFADYDNDNDGYVDGVYIIYAGYGEEAGGGNNPNAIWAHAWNISPSLTLDGKTISKYSCSAELRGNSGSNITRIGVICHEFGHVLGAPDYYDTNYATGGSYSGTGRWDMMAGGSWNNSGATPAHHNAFTKVVYYNWATVQVLTEPTAITLLNSSENSNSFYRINTATNNEYFIIENREKHKFDSYIPGSGMIIYHVHSGVFNVGNSINATHPQRMYPVCANAGTDPTSDPASYGNINSDGVPFPGSGMITSFTDETLPSSKSWAGANTEKPITNIVRDAVTKTVSFDFMGGASGNPTAFAANPIGPSQIEISWNKNMGMDVVLAVSQTASFGQLQDGLNYNAGQNLDGGGTIIYSGDQSNYTLSMLSANTKYFFKIWSRTSEVPTWSSGIETAATTHCNLLNTLPFVEYFNGTQKPSCWQIIDNQGNGQIWQFGTFSNGLNEGTGNYAYLNSDAFGSSNTQNTDLISPTFDLLNYTNVTIAFKHYYKHYTGSSAKFYYSINGGTEWVQVQQWNASTSNPTSFSQAIPALDGQSNVQFKWNYTGTWGYYWCIDDIELTGSQQNPMYALTLQSNPENAGVLLGMGNYTQGASVQINANAASGFNFISWTKNGEVVSENPQFTYSMPAENTTLVANFEVAIPEMYTISINIIGDGIVTINGNEYTEPIDFAENSTIVLEAISSNGNHFSGWQGDFTLVGSVHSFPLTSNVTLTATFDINTYSLTLTIEGQGTVLINDDLYSEPITLAHGLQVNLEALAADGWRFDQWLGDYTGTSNLVSFVFDNEKSITAQFSEVTSTGLTLLQQVEMYPNPFGHTLHLSNSWALKQVVFVNVLGQTVANFEMNGTGTNQINTSLLPKGVYIVTLIGIEGEREVRRLIKK